VPEIILGTAQITTHPAGFTGNDSGTGWAGSFSAAQLVGLFSHTITVTNPAGGRVVGRSTFTCNNSGGSGTEMQGSVTVDGGTQTVYGLFYFNTSTSRWFEFDFSWSTPVLTPVAHTIGIGVWVAAGTVNFQSANQAGDSFCWEIA